MEDIVIINENELSKILKEEISSVFDNYSDLFNQSNELPVVDTINLTSAIAFLAENGYDISKSKLYKLSSERKIPCKKFGNKLIFSRKELLDWMQSNTRSKLTY